MRLIHECKFSFLILFKFVFTSLEYKFFSLFFFVSKLLAKFPNINYPFAYLVAENELFVIYAFYLIQK